MSHPSRSSSKDACANGNCGPARFTVALIGAAGGIGQPLALLLKANPLIKQLNLFDVAPTNGIAMDLSHINTPATVVGFSGKDKMKSALSNADVVVSVAGVTIKPGQTRDDVFAINASIIKNLALGIAESCPNAMIACVSNPVNSLVPLIVEVLKSKNVHGAENRVFGVCTLDVIRACTFAAEHESMDRSKMIVPVIGAHAGITIIPVTSQANPQVNFKSKEEENQYHIKVQQAGHKVLEAKEGKGTATLSMAYAAARFANSLLKGLSGHETVECTFVKSSVTAATYFSNPIIIGKHGVKQNLGYGTLSKEEDQRVKDCLPELIASIKKGEEFAHK